MSLAILSFVGNKFRERRQRWQKRRYTPWTYSEHLRACGARVGDGCFIASMTLEVGIEPYLLKIGNHVAIDQQVGLMTHDGAAWVFRHLIADLQVYGPIVIADNCSIGRGAILCPGIRVGPNSIVAPGAVVIADVPPGSIVSGVPARVIGSTGPDGPVIR
jgi:acetyltransferase-like isoleucine patch superfamily enzyme